VTVIAIAGDPAAEIDVLGIVTEKDPGPVLVTENERMVVLQKMTVRKHKRSHTSTGTFQHQAMNT